MKTVLKTGNRSKVKTGNPRTRIVTGIRSRVLGAAPVEPPEICYRLLEDGDFRLLEDGFFRVLEQCPSVISGNGFDYTLDFTFE